MTAEDQATVVTIGGRGIRLTNPDRVLWPRTGFTKRELIDYYLGIADVLLPHLRERPVTLRRFPEGVDGPGWYQANCRGRRAWVTTHDVRGQRGELLRYCLVDECATLAWLANLGTIELHPFLWRVASPAEPSALVLDLDPGPPASLVAAAKVALLARAVLQERGIDAAVKTSGSLGLHLYVPLAAGHSFDATKRFARTVAERLAAEAPDLVLATSSRAERAGRVFVDWVQNDANRSTVAAYSVRATPWPLVSTPVTWAEVETAASEGRGELLLFGPRQVRERVARFGDLFAPALDRTHTLPTEGEGAGTLVRDDGAMPRIDASRVVSRGGIDDGDGHAALFSERRRDLP
jgi:bifunctional non-homologous end joining protein LigD